MATSDFDKGVEKATSILGGGLGRIKRDSGVQEATKGYRQDILDQKKLGSRYEKMADEGMSPEAREAMRSGMAKQMAASERLMGMKMGGSMGGAKGASAMAQQRALQSQSMMGRANIDRDIFLKNEETKMKGLEGMQTSLQQGREASKNFANLAGQVAQFDINQATTEKQLKGSMGMQYEQMASSERAAEKAAQAQIAMANAQSSGGKK